MALPSWILPAQISEVLVSFPFPKDPIVKLESLKSVGFWVLSLHSLESKIIFFWSLLCMYVYVRMVKTHKIYLRNHFQVCNSVVLTIFTLWYNGCLELLCLAKLKLYLSKNSPFLFLLLPLPPTAKPLAIGLLFMPTS